MKILTVSGSSQATSTNTALLQSIPTLLPDHQVLHYADLHKLPLYLADTDLAPWPPSVLAWRAAIGTADAVIISTPEYLHSLPAILKNALEWLTTLGELHGKTVLPITYTPAAPRGEKGMQVLLWSLQALAANILPALSLHHSDIRPEAGQLAGDAEHIDMLLHALSLMTDG